MTTTESRQLPPAPSVRRLVRPGAATRVVAVGTLGGGGFAGFGLWGLAAATGLWILADLAASEGAKIWRRRLG